MRFHWQKGKSETWGQQIFGFLIYQHNSTIHSSSKEAAKGRAEWKTRIQVRWPVQQFVQMSRLQQQGSLAPPQRCPRWQKFVQFFHMYRSGWQGTPAWTFLALEVLGTRMILRLHIAEVLMKFHTVVIQLIFSFLAHIKNVEKLKDRMREKERTQNEKKEKKRKN